MGSLDGVARLQREFLKVTPRSIDQGIASIGGFTEIRYWFDSKTSASVKLDRRWWTDQNSSWQGDAVFTRNMIYHRRFHLDAGALTSHESFAHDMLRGFRILYARSLQPLRRHL